MIIDTIIGAIVNAGMQAAANKEAAENREWQGEENERNRAWAAEQAALDRKENYQYGEMAADNADARTRALYKDLESPSALLQQYKEAGLSPSLMFGGSGVGGNIAQGAQGTGANGISTMQPAYKSPIEAEQVALMKAQERKLNAESMNILGLDDKELAEIGNLIADAKNKLADAGYKEAAEAVQVAQSYSIRVNTGIDAAKGEYDINKARAEAEIAAEKAKKAIFETLSAFAQAQVDEATVKDRIGLVRSQVENINMDTIVKNSLKGLNDAEVQRVNAEIQKWQTEIEQGWEDLSIKLMNAKTEQEKTVSWKSTKTHA